MNIKRAKQEIENTVKAYLVKDALGEYAIPAIRQRPVLLMGPPGIGKTQIMEQIARECGVALVAYTITHHTRQSAVGLPFIRQKSYGGRDVSVTEYTMSEIIASVYEKMKTTGLSEGILFIDEINCVSETLAPTMLQFLQCKTFGNQAVPAGWVIVAAGNPPEYNKSVRDFDIVTLDRVKRMDIEPDLAVWKDYARAAGLHSAILSYLALHPQSFYQINADVDGTQFVTARGWEDLSNLLDTYETLGLAADEDVIHQYLQHKKIAEDFSAYLDLYYRYRDDYGVEEILAGHTKPAVFARLLNAPFDERLSLVSLLLAGLSARFADARESDAVTDECYAQLKAFKAALSGGMTPSADRENEDAAQSDAAHGGAERGTQSAAAAPNTSSESTEAVAPAAPPASPYSLFDALCAAYEAEAEEKRRAGLLDKPAYTVQRKALALLRTWQATLLPFRGTDGDPAAAFAAVRGGFAAQTEAREQRLCEAGRALESAFDFMEQAFGEGQELVVFVTELTLSPAAHAYIAENDCARYFRYNKSLLLDSRRAALQSELSAEARRNGGV